MNKLPLIAMLAAATPMPVAAAPAPTVTTSLTVALTICRATYFGDVEAAKAAFVGLPSDAERQMVAIVCIAYKQGALDVLEAAKQSRGNVA